MKTTLRLGTSVKVVRGSSSMVEFGRTGLRRNLFPESILHLVYLLLNYDRTDLISSTLFFVVLLRSDKLLHPIETAELLDLLRPYVCILAGKGRK